MPEAGWGAAAPDVRWVIRLPREPVPGWETQLSGDPRPLLPASSALSFPCLPVLRITLSPGAPGYNPVPLPPGEGKRDLGSSCPALPSSWLTLTSDLDWLHPHPGP